MQLLLHVNNASCVEECNNRELIVRKSEIMARGCLSNVLTLNIEIGIKRVKFADKMKKSPDERYKKKSARGNLTDTFWH